MPRYNTEDERKAAHKEVVMKKNRKYYDKNVDKRREYGREYNKRRRADMTELELKEDGQKNKVFKWKRWCREPLELIENYGLAKDDGFTGWCIHHRLETHRYTDRSRTAMERRDEDVPMKVLKFFGLYENRPASELVFMRNGEHARLHNTNKHYRFGKKLISEEEQEARRKKWREGNREKLNANTKRYNSQICLYDGKEIKLGNLARRFMRLGDKHPYQTARKYVVDPSLYSASVI